MKITVEFEIEIEGECAEEKVEKQFMEWFDIDRFKISPDADDDDYQVWIRGWEVKL
jgi:hypothetical protein